MLQEQVICFELGYQVKNKTKFHRKLVDLFGIAGTVQYSRKGEVEKFNVIMDYGRLELNSNRTVLMLEIRLGDFGGVLSSVEINNLYKKLKDSLIIKSDKAWYFESVAAFEI